MTYNNHNSASPLYGAYRTSTDQADDPTCWVSKVACRLKISQRLETAAKRVVPRTPQTSQERRDASLNDDTRHTARIPTQSDVAAAEEKEKTFLYLAYGSNLCNETFRGVRGIQPLSQINVIVPSLRLTFDLPGIPYTEPCFANSAVRDPESASHAGNTGYHKDRWHKGMVGCVYEVTPSDYAHIIATEGGGTSYKDVLVDCYPLPEGDRVPDTPSTLRFKAHTLFAPAAEPTVDNTAHLTRPDPSYAQPSARYLKLLTDGAVELSLPSEYQIYLNNIHAYTITTKRQAVGKALFASIWMPFIMLFFALSKKLQDKDGKTPAWLGMVVGWLFKGMWVSYDHGFKGTFGDGERTEGDDEDERITWSVK